MNKQLSNSSRRRSASQSGEAPAAGQARVGARVRRANRRGTAAVEFAIVVPIFIAFVFGIFEFGRLVMVQQLITTASREGARLAITENAAASGVQSAVDAYLTNASVSSATVTVTPSTLASAQPGDTITVAVQIPFEEVSWLPSPMFITNTTLTASSAMRREGIR